MRYGRPKGCTKHTKKPHARYCNSRRLIANLCKGSQCQSVIYPYSILNSAPNFHSYFTLWCFRCLPIPYSDVSDVSWCFPMFSDVFHTPMFSYSTLQHFRHFLQSSKVFLHSDAFPTPMFLKSSCSILFQVHAPMFSNVFPIFIDAEPFQSYYGLIIIMEPFQ